MKWIVLSFILLLFLSNFVSAETIKYCDGNDLITITNNTITINNTTTTFSEIDRTHCVFGCNNNECVYSNNFSILLALMIIVLIIFLIKIIF